MSIKLKTLLDIYEEKLKVNKVKNIDQNKLKNEIKEKLFLEVEGVRIINSKYKELNKIDKSSLSGIVKEVQHKIYNTDK